MKRSEALKIIVEELDLHEEDQREPEEVAEHILKSLEKAGMLPPGRPVIVEHAEPYELVEGFPLIGSIEDRNTWEEE